MALAPLAPWLNVGPVNYLEAAKAGTQAGLGIAGLRQRAALAQQEAAQQAEAQAFREEEAARQDALRRWELGQTLAQKAAEQAAESERAAANLAETQRYRLDQTALGREQLAAETGWRNKMAEASLMKAGGADGAGGGQIVTHEEVPGRLFLRQPSGHEVLLPNASGGEFTQPQLIDYTLQAGRAMQPGPQESRVSPSFLNRSNQVWQLMEPVRQQIAAQQAAKTNAPAAGTNAPPQLLSTPATVAPPAATNTIVRKVKGSNRKAEFDANTKSFIRWVD